MMNIDCKIIETTAGWDWSAIIQAVVSIWVAIVATLALYTWKSQAKAKRQDDFLDTLLDSTHNFIILMEGPIAMVQWVKMDMQSHADLSPADTRLNTPGAIAYITRNGENHSKQLGELLEKCRPALTKVQSLIIKGKVLGIMDDGECNEYSVLIKWPYERILGFSQVIGDTTLNWGNPEVQETVDNVLALEAEDIREYSKEQYSRFIEFVQTKYEAIYG